MSDTVKAKSIAVAGLAVANDQPLTLFGGINAFPGMDGHVTSIKYRRKYKTILNSDPKPGYASYYFEDWRP